jgi:two-component system chemotaxis response regulator CheB
MRRIKVLVVDDAVVVRKIIGEVLGVDPELEVVGTAPNGRIALAKLPQLAPDLVMLDLEMPELDGLDTLRELRRSHPKLPVIMFSTLTRQGAKATLEAMARGASDYVTKPSSSVSLTLAIDRLRAELIPKIKALCGATQAAAPSPSAARCTPIATRIASSLPRRIDLVAIGVSTGGPNALSQLIGALPADLPVPVVIVQHMPPLFTRLLAERLAESSPLPVAEAVPGAVLAPPQVWLAPGDFHLAVEQVGGDVVLRTHQQPPENSCRPAVDVLFRCRGDDGDGPGWAPRVRGARADRSRTPSR